MTNKAHCHSSYRWTMLGLSFLGGFSEGLLWLSTAPLVLAVERDLELNASRVAFWLNIPLACAVLLCIPIGLAIDNWGPKQVGRVGVTLLAFGAIARGFASSYNFLLIATLIFGVGYMVFFVALSKSLALWFPHREIGMANGVLLTGAGAGSALGLLLVAPVFGNDWRHCFRVLGWVGIGMVICWWLLAREPVPAEDLEHPSQAGTGQAVARFKKVLAARTTWLLTLSFSCYIAGFQSWFTFGFPYLVRFRAINENLAGMVLTLTMVGYTFAAISMPALSDRVGRRLPFFLYSSALGCGLFFALPFVKFSAFAWIAAVLIGVCFGTINPLVFTVAAEAKELGPAVVGASLGTIISLGSIAGFLVPVAIGRFLGSLNYATERGFYAIWLLTAAWLGGILACSLALTETGPTSQASSD